MDEHAIQTLAGIVFGLAAAAIVCVLVAQFNALCDDVHAIRKHLEQP